MRRLRAATRCFTIMARYGEGASTSRPATSCTTRSVPDTGVSHQRGAGQGLTRSWPPACSPHRRAAILDRQNLRRAAAKRLIEMLSFARRAGQASAGAAGSARAIAPVADIVSDSARRRVVREAREPARGSGHRGRRTRCWRSEARRIEFAASRRSANARSNSTCQQFCCRQLETIRRSLAKRASAAETSARLGALIDKGQHARRGRDPHQEGAGAAQRMSRRVGRDPRCRLGELPWATPARAPILTSTRRAACWSRLHHGLARASNSASSGLAVQSSTAWAGADP